jgi:hypothetical protein
MSDGVEPPQATLLGVPSGAGPPHIVQLGPIRIPDGTDQRVPSLDDPPQYAVQRHGVLSVWLAEDGCERQGQDFLAELIGDVQDPSPPILRVWPHKERVHQLLRVVARLGQIHGGAASIDENMLGIIGAVEEDFGHVPLPVANHLRSTGVAGWASAEYSG